MKIYVSDGIPLLWKYRPPPPVRLLPDCGGADEFFEAVGKHFRRAPVALGGEVYAVFGGPSLVEPVFHAAYAAHCVLPRPKHRLPLTGDAPLHLLDFGQEDGARAAYAERVFSGIRARR